MDMFKLNLRKVNVSEDLSSSLARLADLTEGYSGADLRLLCRDAAMIPMRRAVEGKTPSEIMALRGALQREQKGYSVDYACFEESLARVRPSSSIADLKRFEEWQKEYGAN